MTSQQRRSTRLPVTLQSAHIAPSCSAKQRACCQQAVPHWWVNPCTLFRQAREIETFILCMCPIQTKLWKWRSPLQVLSGGVASNQYIRKALRIIADKTGLQLLCPPAKFCTDNGVMIAWNGVERLREGKGILPPNVDVSYEPKWVNQLWLNFLFYSLCCWFKSAFA